MPDAASAANRFCQGMDAAKVTPPTPLIEYTKGLREVEADGNTIDVLRDDPDRRDPAIGFRMIDEQRQIGAHIMIFVNAQLERSLNFPLTDQDLFIIVAAVFSG